MLSCRFDLLVDVFFSATRYIQVLRTATHTGCQSLDLLISSRTFLYIGYRSLIDPYPDAHLQRSESTTRVCIIMVHNWFNLLIWFSSITCVDLVLLHGRARISRSTLVFVATQVLLVRLICCLSSETIMSVRFRARIKKHLRSQAYTFWQRAYLFRQCERKQHFSMGTLSDQSEP